VNTGTVNPPASLRTGKHFLSFFAQDSWKVTRKLTLDYGLRYDYFTYPREQYGRQPSLSPSVANPTTGGIPGGIIYEATCNCSFAKNYPYAFGPRLGLAYQFLPKTVFRMGIGISYDGTATRPAQVCGSEQRFQAPGFGTESMTLSGGYRSGMFCLGQSFPWGLPIELPGKPQWSANVVDPNAGRRSADTVEPWNTA
jgi:hypothetical protein